MDKILSGVKIYINGLFKRRNQPILKYHNLHHTEMVVARSLEISDAYTLSPKEKFNLVCAAWFHDTGHLFNELQDHEKTGADLMSSYLTTQMVPEDDIQIITRCILVTKLPSHPVSLIEQIICDADTYHFGTKEFRQTDPKIYEEMEARLSTTIENKLQKSLRLLESHQFYTRYCQDLLNRGKLDNINYLRQMGSAK